MEKMLGQDLEVKLAELLCTRLCHDLTGPIGAVNNGAEFLGDDGFSLPEQAVGLIVNSAQQAVNRLMFYRQAYGRVNYQGEASLNEVRKLSEDFFKSSRFILHWPHHFTDSADVSLSRKMAKLLLNMLIIVSGGMPRGGNIHVSLGKSEKGAEVKLRGEGTGVREDKEMIAAFRMETDIADITPKTAQPYFTARLADSLGVELNMHITSDVFEIVALHA